MRNTKSVSLSAHLWHCRSFPLRCRQALLHTEEAEGGARRLYKLYVSFRLLQQQQQHNKLPTCLSADRSVNQIGVSVAAAIFGAMGSPPAKVRERSHARRRGRAPCSRASLLQLSLPTPSSLHLLGCRGCCGGAGASRALQPLCSPLLPPSNWYVSELQWKHRANGILCFVLGVHARVKSLKEEEAALEEFTFP